MNTKNEDSKKKSKVLGEDSRIKETSAKTKESKIEFTDLSWYRKKLDSSQKNK